MSSFRPFEFVELPDVLTLGQQLQEQQEALQEAALLVEIDDPDLPVGEEGEITDDDDDDTLVDLDATIQAIDEPPHSP